MNLKSDVKKYIFAYGRPLEQALFNFYFENGSPDDVLYELSLFQNEDGGFGHALEPDFYTPESNPIDTWVASNIIKLLPVKTHPLIDRMIDYLLHCPYQTDQLYAFSILSINDHPHAPWWHYDPHVKPSYNPTASLLGFLLHYMPNNHPMYMQIHKRTSDAITYFINAHVEEMHELTCFIELFHVIDDDGLKTPEFTIRLRKQILKILDYDDTNWFSSYTVKPSHLILYPDTPGYDLARDLVHLEHQLMIEHRNEHGVWSITWDWSSEDLIAFEKTKKAWEGIIALNALIRFERFNFGR